VLDLAEGGAGLVSELEERLTGSVSPADLLADFVE
jgi:hypothetical protein